MKTKKIASHLRFVTRLLKNWDFNTQSNTGIFKDKIRFMTISGFRVFTKPQLERHIECVRSHLRNEMAKR